MATAAAALAASEVPGGDSACASSPPAEEGQGERGREREGDGKGVQQGIPLLVERVASAHAWRAAANRQLTGGRRPRPEMVKQLLAQVSSFPVSWKCSK